MRSCILLPFLLRAEFVSTILLKDLGATPVVVEFIRGTFRNYGLVNGLPTRSIWYVRYIDWSKLFFSFLPRSRGFVLGPDMQYCSSTSLAITTPLLLLEILLCTGLPLSEVSPLLPLPPLLKLTHRLRDAFLAL